MLNSNVDYLNSYKTPKRELEGYITYTQDEVEHTLAANGQLVSFKIERTAPEGKIFGFAVSQKISIEALGIVDIKKGTELNPVIKIKDSEEIVALPHFFVDTVEVDKVGNKTKIEGYDILNSSLAIGELEFTYPTTLSAYAQTICSALGATMAFEGVDAALESAPNFNGDEGIQTALTALAEATGTICYVSTGNVVRFRKLVEDVVDTLTTSHYFNFSTKETNTITRIVSATELGDNIDFGNEGYTVALWENPFLVLRAGEEVGSCLEAIGAAVIGLGNTGYDLKWRGCPAYEIGDRIAIIDKDQVEVKVYYLNESLEFAGGLQAESEWKPIDEDNLNAAPSSLGKVLSQTYAKVDKVNKEISLVVQEQDGIKESISSIILDTEGIKATVASQDEEIKKLAEITLDEDAIVSRVEASVGATMDEKDAAVKSEMTSLIEQTATTIRSEVSAADEAAKTELRSEITQTANSITSTVTAAQNRADSAYSLADDAYDYADDAYTLAEQTEDKFSWIVDSGTKASNMTLTDEFLSIIADEVVIDADVRLYGEMKLYASSSGSTYGGWLSYGSGNYGDGTSTGVMLSSKDEYSYFIATNYGVRMTYDDTYAVHCTDLGVTLVGDYDFRAATNFMCRSSGKASLGTSSYKWASVYATTGTIQTSDERAKNTINYGLDRYEELFMDLKPAYYKFNDGTSDRFHIGFISQDVETSINSLGLDSKDFAGFIKSPVYEKELKNGEDDITSPIVDYNYSLRYDEFVALNTHMIQKLMARVNELEAEVKTLKGE